MDIHPKAKSRTPSPSGATASGRGMFTIDNLLQQQRKDPNVSGNNPPIVQPVPGASQPPIFPPHLGHLMLLQQQFHQQNGLQPHVQRFFSQPHSFPSAPGPENHFSNGREPDVAGLNRFGDRDRSPDPRADRQVEEDCFESHNDERMPPRSDHIEIIGMRRHDDPGNESGGKVPIVLSCF